jgi:heme oxygenase
MPLPVEWTGELFDRTPLLGTLYVLEGSSMGARVLLGNARRLGFSGLFGARHLEQQAAGLHNWRMFIALLEAAPDIDIQSLVDAANDAFSAAKNAFLRVDDDGP